MDDEEGVWGKVSELARGVGRRLPIAWRARIKHALGRPISPQESLSLVDVQGRLRDYRSERTQVLFWRGPPGSAAVFGESHIALALRLRGVGVRFVICDSVLSGCLERSIDQEAGGEDWDDQCARCQRFGEHTLEAFGLPYSPMSEFVSAPRRAALMELCQGVSAEELPEFIHEGVPVGRFAKVSALRYLRGRDLEGRASLLREYLYSALVATEAARAALHELKPERIFLQRHLQYVASAPAFWVFAEAGLPITLWSTSLARSGTISLRTVRGRDTRAIYELSPEAWRLRSLEPLAAEESEALDSIAKLPWRQPSADAPTDRRGPGRQEVLDTLGVSDEKPLWCMFTHLTWDPGFHPEQMTFEDVYDWMRSAINAMLASDDVHWIIKIHPGETQGTHRGAQAFFDEEFPDLAERVTIVPPTVVLSASDLAQVISGATTLRGTVGMQLPQWGIPVIVGERTHYAARGFTLDGLTKENYTDLIRRAAEHGRLSDDQIELARRYAFAAFFQRRIPINAAELGSAYRAPDLGKLEHLFPGADRAMDLIAERILSGGEFILEDPLGLRSAGSSD